ncbi:hypothetical protein ACFWAN_34610 [Streptomyces mirabilis]|uniref:hypothetical protein n=1 Tax=Streptomyces mirabilis TaxID=68239 RepID=UPI003653F0F8
MTATRGENTPSPNRSPWTTALLMTPAIGVLGTARLGWIHLKLNGNINTFATFATFDADGLSTRPIRLDHSRRPRLSLMMSV